jgi:8-oxo-dGTP pyrophosphatase MutT (NUDIX family)
MKKKRIRVIALGVFYNQGKILVFQGHDLFDGDTFFRPLGGGVEFGETGENALIREIREELGLEIKDPRYLGTLENIFVFMGEPGHEVVLVHDAQFVDHKVYEATNLQYVEGDGEHMPCQWLALEDVEKKKLHLYPLGLYELLTDTIKKSS